MTSMNGKIKELLAESGLDRHVATSKAHYLDDSHSVMETPSGSRIFATVPGTCRPDVNLSSLTLDDGAMNALIEWYMDGCCPVCGVEINHTEIICDGCYEQAKQHRVCF